MQSTAEQRYPQAEETFEENIGHSWEANQDAMREARRSAAQRRLDELINP